MYKEDLALNDLKYAIKLNQIYKDQNITPTILCLALV